MSHTLDTPSLGQEGATSGSKGVTGILAAALLAAAVGLADGVATFLVEDLGSSPVWFGAVHTLGPWALITAGVGMVLRDRWRLAALAGLITQVGLVVGYYGASALLGSRPLETGQLVLYAGVGVVSGPFFGAAGALVRHRRAAVRISSLGLVAGAWLADAARTLAATLDVRTRVVPHLLMVCFFLAVGMLLPLVIGRSRRDWAASLAVATGVCALIVLGLDVVLPQM